MRVESWAGLTCLWSREGTGGTELRECSESGAWLRVQPQHSAKRTKEGTLASLMWLEDAHMLADAIPLAGFCLY